MHNTSDTFQFIPDGVDLYEPRPRALTNISMHKRRKVLILKAPVDLVCRY